MAGGHGGFREYLGIACSPLQNGREKVLIKQNLSGYVALPFAINLATKDLFETQY